MIDKDEIPTILRNWEHLSGDSRRAVHRLRRLSHCPSCYQRPTTCVRQRLWDGMLYSSHGHYHEPSNMLIGYARISTGEQNLDLQVDDLRDAGCDRVFTDAVSGAKSELPGLTEALAFLRGGDTLVVWRLDRMGRSLKDLVQQIDDLRSRNIAFRSLHENIDTASPVGKFQFHVFSALAEFERDLIRQRTLAGLRAARARGRSGGRKRLMTTTKIKMAAQLLGNRNLSITEICKTLAVSKSTLFQYVGPDGSIREPAK